VTSLAIGAAYVLLAPPEESAPLERIHSRDIQDILISGARTTADWRVRSRTANYFTRVTLPALAGTERAIKIRLQMLDPENQALIASYVKFRSSHRRGAEWKMEQVRKEIYSSLLLLATHCNYSPRLEVEVALSPAFWVLSIDIFDGKAVVTGQNKGEPALVFRRGDELFDAYADDFDAGYGDCRHIVPRIHNLRPADLERPLRADDLDAIRKMYLAVGLTACDDNEIREIVQTATGGSHNYV
jgi:hypothetical protein